MGFATWTGRHAASRSGGAAKDAAATTTVSSVPAEDEAATSKSGRGYEVACDGDVCRMVPLQRPKTPEQGAEGVRDAASSSEALQPAPTAVSHWAGTSWQQSPFTSSS